MEYDVCNRQTIIVTIMDSITTSVAYAYDLNGNRTQVAFGTNLLEYAYDLRNALTNVAGAIVGQVSYGYDALGRRTGGQYPNTVQSTWSWDAASRLTALQYQKGAFTFLSRDYSHDPHGNITSMEINAGLLPQIDPQVTRLRQADNDELSEIQTAATPDGDWTTVTPSYDPDGNLLDDGTSDFYYDFENRLIEVVQSTATSRYIYTGDGERIARTQIEGGQSNTVYYLLDRTDAYSRPLAELDATGGVRRIFVWGRGLIAQVTFDATGSGTVHYVHHDGQGSTLALTDSAGQITDQWFYSPYGEILNRSGTNDIPYQWCGGVGVAREPSGLYYMKARYYHPELKRWITVDPIGLAGGINMYAYAALNPLIYFDPMGLCAEGYWREEGPSWGQGYNNAGNSEYDGPVLSAAPLGDYTDPNPPASQLALTLGANAPAYSDNTRIGELSATTPAILGGGALIVSAGPALSVAEGFSISASAYYSASLQASVPGAIEFVDGFLSPNPPSSVAGGWGALSRRAYDNYIYQWSKGNE